MPRLLRPLRRSVGAPVLALAVAVLGSPVVAGASPGHHGQPSAVGGTIGGGPGGGGTSSTQPTAHDGKFWQGSTWVVFHGMKESVETGNVSQTIADVAQEAAWGFNFVRLHVHWSDLEANHPVKNGTTWTHTYNADYVSAIKQDLAAISSHGMWALIENDGDQIDSFFGYPAWLYQAAYNSHAITYSANTSGLLQAQTNFWSDALQQQFMSDFLRYLAMQLAPVGGIAGYEVLNEPQAGNLVSGTATTQSIVNWQLAAAKVIRAADPNRIIAFTTHEGFGPGISDPALNLTDWVTPPPSDANGLPEPLGIPDVAFDAHDYFGGRWGTGLNRGAGTSYQEAYQVLYNNTLAPSAPPYIGTTLGQLRWIQDKTTSLARWNIPLIVAELGDPYTDPGAPLLFGTATAALNSVWVSWSISGSNNGIIDGNGNLRSYGQIVIDAAKKYP